MHMRLIFFYHILGKFAEKYWVEKSGELATKWYKFIIMGA